MGINVLNQLLNSAARSCCKIKNISWYLIILIGVFNVWSILYRVRVDLLVWIFVLVLESFQTSLSLLCHVNLIWVRFIAYFLPRFHSFIFWVVSDWWQLKIFCTLNNGRVLIINLSIQLWLLRLITKTCLPLL